MKQGKTLTELATEIERQVRAKKDYIAPTAKMKAVATIEKGAPVFGINLEGSAFFPTTDLANTQLATYTGIPAAYFRRMEQEAPGLLAVNVNRWLEDSAKKDERRMIRTLDGKLRAILSDKFRPLDNYDLANQILPVINTLGLKVYSAQITETRMYIKAIDPGLEAKVPSGQKLGEGHSRMDAVAAGMIVSNSEVGHGSLSIEAGIYTFHCTNLATFGSKIRKYHVGSRADISAEVYALLTDETKAKTDAALWGQVRDVVTNAFTPAVFQENCRKLSAASTDQMNRPVTEVIEVAQKHFGWNETESSNVLKHLIAGGDLSRYGLHSAVTRMSADVESYDRASEFERQGGQIIELTPAEWTRLAA